MKIEVVKQKRKTITLKIVDSKNAVLKVPLSFSDKKVSSFLESKKAWLEKVVFKLKQREDFEKGLNLENCVYLCGKQVGVVDDIFIGSLNDDEKLKELKKFYIAKFPLLVDFSQKLSAQTGLNFSKVKITNSKHIWGSFSSDKVMKLNWKLIILPTNLIEYVILHELCHGVQMNHSPKFWATVERLCPDFKERKKELQNYNFVLSKVF